MTNSRKSIAIILLFVSSVFAGCGLASDNSAAKDVAAKFYDALKTGDVATAASYCGTDETMSSQAWQDLFTQNLNTMGKVTGYESGSGFNVSKEGEKSTVRVAYDVDYEYGKSIDSLTIISLGDDFKVFVYSPKIKEAKFQDELAKAKAIATDYLIALKAGDHAKAMSYIGYSGTSKHTSDEWNNFYVYVENSAGPMTGMQINEDACVAYLNDDHEEAGHGNLYSVVYTTIHSGMTLTNQIDFFQPKFDDELKIIAHNVK